MPVEVQSETAFTLLTSQMMAHRYPQGSTSLIFEYPTSYNATRPVAPGGSWIKSEVLGKTLHRFQCVRYPQTGF